ncbi:hypothetical protein [Haliscomenobacter sp.]|uniref:hypothetical protein n=1 Tax=Haliscomenobacter sp. TaxID=2717303 RepID=UPI00336511B5
MANNYTGKEINLIDLTTAKELVDAYQKIKVKVGDLDPINYAFFSVTALEELVTFLKSNPEAKGVKFNLAVVTTASQSSTKALSLVTWAVDENGNPIASAERALGDGSATQSSGWPCPDVCIPPL